MDSTLVGIVTVAALVVVQIGMFAYGYGKLSQKVNDLSKYVHNDVCGRLDKLEKAYNSNSKKR